MRFWLIIVATLSLYLVAEPAHAQWVPPMEETPAKAPPAPPAVPATPPAVQPAPVAQPATPAEEPATDEGNYDEEGAGDQIIPAVPFGGAPGLPARPPSDEETTAEEAAGPEVPKQLKIDMVVSVDYQFFGSANAFKIKYHINMGGDLNLVASLIKGDAEVATEVTGYLAKWPQGQCVLKVSIAKVPYEITYKDTGTEADISISFKRDIMENWTSTCTFSGGAKPFITEGPPEKWIGTALEKASPPISSLVTPLEKNEPSSTTFNISEYTVTDENVGSAKVSGKGIVTIQPQGPKKATKTNGEAETPEE